MLTVGWLSGQKQRSVKPSGCALHRFESYPNHHLIAAPRRGAPYRFWVPGEFFMDYWIVIASAAGLGLVHTLLAPNHYLPFIMISKARKWSRTKTVLITLLCSSGHVIGSLVIALLAVVFGVVTSKIEIFNGYRANIAAWGMMIFGFMYFLYGVREAKHNHRCCEHIHTKKNDVKSLTPFILFMLFLFAPCEAFVPIMMLPALTNVPVYTVLIAFSFGLTTMATMVVAVYLGARGIEFLPFEKWEKYGHMIAGAVIFLCGVFVTAFGH